MTLDNDSIKRIDDLRNSINKRIEDLRAELLRLREADNKDYDRAIQVAYEGVRDRMEGFPQQYATKPDMDSVKEGLQKLERDAISREIYDSQYKALDELVRNLDKGKLDEKEFQQFKDNQLVKDEEAANERRAVAAGLARSTETVAQTLAAREDRAEGAKEKTTEIRATRGQVIATVTIALGLATFILSIVILASNGKL
jgi:hypothetical protein